MIYGQCDFCFRPATASLTSYSHAWWRRVLGMPRKTCRCCARCTDRAIRFLSGR